MQTSLINCLHFPNFKLFAFRLEFEIEEFWYFLGVDAIARVNCLATQPSNPNSVLLQPPNNNILIVVIELDQASNS